jgi:hypothetical protein
MRPHIYGLPPQTVKELLFSDLFSDVVSTDNFLSVEWHMVRRRLMNGKGFEIECYGLERTNLKLT